jgi:hypothetical protein
MGYYTDHYIENNIYGQRNFCNYEGGRYNLNQSKGGKPMKTPITLRTLEKRIGRRLAKENQSLHKTRIRKRTKESLGPYYIVNDSSNSIAVQMINRDRLVEIGKEMHVLANWEEVKI